MIAFYVDNNGHLIWKRLAFVLHPAGRSLHHFKRIRIKERPKSIARYFLHGCDGYYGA